MGWPHITLLMLAVSVGYLIWRGSRNLTRAITGAIIVPGVAFGLLGFFVGAEGLQAVGFWGLVVLLIAIIGLLAWRHSAPSQ